eukprot:15747000-Heterocapsa_arctica.AAC.1
MEPVMHASDQSTAADSLRVVETAPLEAIPADVLGDLQSGVRQEPVPPPKPEQKSGGLPTRPPWAEVESDDEDPDARSSTPSVADLDKDSVEYARQVFPINDPDWACPET